MARIQEFFESRRDLGPPAAVAYLDSWLDERAGMNAALRKKATPDIAKIAEQEARVREAIGKLERAKLAYRQSDAKGADELATQTMKELGGLSRENARVAGALAVAKTAADIDAKKIAAETNLQLQDKLTVQNPKVVSVLGNSARSTATQGGARGVALVGTATNPGPLLRVVTDQLAELGNPAPGTPEHDGAVTLAIRSAEANGDRAAAQALAEASGAGPGQSWADYMATAHPGVTQQDVKDMLERTDRRTAGGSAKAIWDAYDRLKGEGGGGTSSGLSVERVFDPADADKTIEQLEEAADDLADARRRALADTDNYFPRPNYVIANPNTYTASSYYRAAHAWGGMDPIYTEEVSHELQRQHGAWGPTYHALSARGGLALPTMSTQAPAKAEAPRSDWTMEEQQEAQGHEWARQQAEARPYEQDALQRAASSLGDTPFWRGARGYLAGYSRDRADALNPGARPPEPPHLGVIESGPGPTAARPSDDQPLAIGIHPDRSGRVRAPDLATEAGGTADPFDIFSTEAAPVAAPHPTSEEPDPFDTFLKGSPR